MTDPTNSLIDKTPTHTYYAGLDSLRAIAIILVIISHWLPYDHFLNAYLPNGPMGVTLFFVLSGYLITGILLNEKSKLEEKKKTFGSILKEFYLKRSLRIFPIYYLTLIVMLLLQFPEVKTFFWWHFSYASNFLFYFQKSFINEYVSPLWSLSVEEQFYFFWPFMILLSNKRWLFFWLGLSVIIGISFRMLPDNLDARPFSYVQFLMPSCVDCFAIGGIVAYIQRFHSEHLTLVKKASILLSVAGMAYLLLFAQNTLNFTTIVFNRNIFSIFAVAFILYIITQPKDQSLLAETLENELFVFIGKISYSLYLWHNLIPYMEFIKNPDQRIWARVAALFLLSTLSYFLFEKPLLSLKKHIK